MFIICVYVFLYACVYYTVYKSIYTYTYIRCRAQEQVTWYVECQTGKMCQVINIVTMERIYWQTGHRFSYNPLIVLLIEMDLVGIYLNYITVKLTY